MTIGEWVKHCSFRNGNPDFESDEPDCPDYTHKLCDGVECEDCPVRMECIKDNGTMSGICGYGRATILFKKYSLSTKLDLI